MKLIAAKLTKIMQACAYVQKTGYNDFHKYKYARAAAILEKANESMVENNVASKVLPRLTEFRDVTTAKGATEHLATVEVTVTLIDTESGETIDLVGMGSGQDAGDKAIMKAQTAALKYAWMMSLNISTGDDPEADENTDKAAAPAAKQQPSTTTPPKPETPLQQDPALPMASEAQRRKIDALRSECGWSVEDTQAELALKFKVKSSKELTLVQAKSLIDLLEKAKAEKKVSVGGITGIDVSKN